MLLHDQLDLARLLVDLALGRNPFDEVFIFDIAGRSQMIGMLCCSHSAIFRLDLDFCAIGKEDLRSQLDREDLQRLDRFVRKQLLDIFQSTSFIADELQRAVLVQGEPMAFFVLHNAKIHVDKNAILIGDQAQGSTPPTRYRPSGTFSSSAAFPVHRSTGLR